jgi:hypothetical protein
VVSVYDSLAIMGDDGHTRQDHHLPSWTRAGTVGHLLPCNFGFRGRIGPFRMDVAVSHQAEEMAFLCWLDACTYENRKAFALPRFVLWLRSVQRDRAFCRRQDNSKIWKIMQL